MKNKHIDLKRFERLTGRPCVLSILVEKGQAHFIACEAKESYIAKNYELPDDPDENGDDSILKRAKRKIKPPRYIG